MNRLITQFVLEAEGRIASIDEQNEELVAEEAVHPEQVGLAPGQSIAPLIVL